jgi:hypothetical protein
VFGAARRPPDDAAATVRVVGRPHRLNFLRSILASGSETPYLGILQTGCSSRTIDNVATSLAWIASHARTIATVDIQEPPVSTKPNMSPTREIPILAAPPQVSCRLRTLPPRQWQRSSEKFAAGNPMTTQPRSASSAALESVRYGKQGCSSKGSQRPRDHLRQALDDKKDEQRDF